MYHMLCCDMSTLRCTSFDLERILQEFSTRYYKVSDGLWLFCAPKYAALPALVSLNEYLVTYLLREYTTPESSVISAPFRRGCYWELPAAAEEFLSVDEPDDDGLT